jgi:hypothetical protein
VSQSAGWLASKRNRTRPGFVYPGFEQTRARYIVMLVTKTVSLTHSRRQLDVVLAQFLQHLGRGDVIGVIVQNAL